MPRQSVTGLWWLRSRMSSRSRRMLRQLTDPWIAPLGSIVSARTTEPVVALTFDDGPDSATTSGVLDVLKEHDAKATFFVLLDRAEANPALIRRIVESGHELGLHGIDHRRLTRMSPRAAATHIQMGVERFRAITGVAPIWFRPPYGSQSLRTFLTARSCGMKVVAWSADCADWTARTEQAIAEQALGSIRPGGILLLHDSLAADPDVTLPEVKIDRSVLAGLILSGMRERGLSSVSISELLATRKAHLTAWFRP